MHASKLDKRRRPNPRLRIAVLICAAILLVSMAYSRATSMARSDTFRPSIELSSLPNLVNAQIASSDALYVSLKRQNKAIKRLVDRNRPLFCAGKKRYAALTIDDGPTKSTPRLVKLLSDAGIPATFFVNGENVKKFPEYTKLLAENGALANHTWDHKSLTTLNKKEIKQQLGDTQTEIRSQTGQNYKAMRPTYGARNEFTVKTIDKLGYAEILWSSDSQDALAKSSSEVAKNAIGGLGPGAVILMHDGHETTIKALRERIIPAIRRSGLTMVTLPDLLALNAPSSRQLDDGPRACGHSGKLTVSGYFKSPRGER